MKKIKQIFSNVYTAIFATLALALMAYTVILCCYPVVFLIFKDKNEITIKADTDLKKCLIEVVEMSDILPRFLINAGVDDCVKNNQKAG
jgi:hypothetical protein